MLRTGALAEALMRRGTASVRARGNCKETLRELNVSPHIRVEANSAGAEGHKRRQPIRVTRFAQINALSQDLIRARPILVQSGIRRPKRAIRGLWRRAPSRDQTTAPRRRHVRPGWDQQQRDRPPQSYPGLSRPFGSRDPALCAATALLPAGCPGL